MRLIIAILAAMVTYVFSVGTLTFVLTSMCSAFWYFASKEWYWVWEMGSTPAMIITILCIGVANFLVEDYIRCQCDETTNSSWG